MPIVLDPNHVIDYLKRFLNNNKAIGMMGELALDGEIGIQNTPHQQKLLAGGWILYPQTKHNFHQHRYLVCVLPSLSSNLTELQNNISILQQNKEWQALASFFSSNGIGVIVSGAWSDPLKPSLDELNWQHYIYQNSQLVSRVGNNPFDLWPGKGGYARKATKEWQPNVIQRFNNAIPDQLTTLGIRQAFYYGYLKGVLKKPLEENYDVDGFVVSSAGRVMAIEIKEKSPTKNGLFGLDAGRILMMLRLCLATDSNALYLIREVDNSPTRQFVAWRYITLAEMVIGCRWNLQAGGKSMNGSSTQTVMMASSIFKPFTLSNFSEKWLAENASLQLSMQNAVNNLSQNLSQYLGD